ncbi:hypothetical protein HKCCE3408_19120 [Rhodobacterales bacterium HKCCE3408]|nr:hypothetical protein [Rhodobacterales bacterium HKCCE3408]
MKVVSKLVVPAALLALSGCVTTTPEGEFAEVSDEVRQIAAPGQNLSAVRLQDDGCYWWLYEGPVETTYIPLETREGRLICTRG